MIKIKTYKLNYKLIIYILLIFVIAVMVFTYSVANAKTENGIELPIIMYHSVLKSRSGDYIVHPSEIENDLQYIQSKGYTTITMTDLINYVYNGTDIPEKPIIITFDDGYYNNLGYVVPILKKYNMKAVISIVGSYTDTYTKSNETNLNYSYLRWQDIKYMLQEGYVEFQNHTYNLHSYKNGRKGCKKKSWESTEKYRNLLIEDVGKLQKEFKENTGYVPNTFTYPYGAISKESLPIIKEMGFKASLSCTSGVNFITKDTGCLYQLKRNNRVSGISSAQFFEKIIK